MNDTNSNHDDWTVDEGVSEVSDALGDILDDSDASTEEDEAAKADEPDDSDDEGEDSSEPDDSDDEEGESEDSDEDDDDERSDGSQDRVRDSKGRFVSDDYRVTLSDGTETTIGDLKSSGLRMSDYTRKTQALARDREQIQALQQQVSQREQQLDEQLAQVSWVLEQFRPQVPPQGSPAEALDAYHAQKAQWDQLSQGWGQEIGKRQQTVQEQQARQIAEHKQREQAKLMAAVPQLADPAKRQAFAAEAVRIAEDYGIAGNELQSILDHRFFLVLRDAMRYRRAQATRPKTRETIEAKPRMNRGTKRADPKAPQKRARRDRTDRLRREQSVEAGVAALMDMDL